MTDKKMVEKTQNDQAEKAADVTIKLMLQLMLR